MPSLWLGYALDATPNSTGEDRRAHGLNVDLFNFWTQIAPHERVHPLDKPIFSRVRKHGFQLRCLPGAYKGRLATAPIVLLYLSPGFHPYDLEEADSPHGQARYVRQRQGNSPLPTEAEHSHSYRWWMQRVKCFGPIPDACSRFAILNLGAYHSRGFADWAMLSTLPSSRVSIDWAQRVLFPQAEEGRRVVICLRSPRNWGLDVQDGPYGEALFAPPVTRGGHMLNGFARDRVIQAVHRILNISN